MGTSVTPNIFDFLIKIDPFDKLPEPVVESIANSVKVKYLVRGETIGFSALCDQRYLYIIRTGAIEQRTLTANCVRALGKMTNLVLLSSTHSKMPKMVTKRKRLKIHCSI